MSLQIIDPTQYPGWDDLLLSTPGHSFFHSSAWAKVLHESYGYTPLYFTALEEDRIKALIPIMEVDSLLTGKRGVSLPFTDYCEPIIDSGVRLEDVFQGIAEHGRKFGWKYIELRPGQNHLNFALPSSTFYNHTLGLSEAPEKLFQKFRKGTKSSIKKAEKDGVRVEILSSIESVREFYRLNCITRKSHGLPPQPWHFFELLHSLVLTSGLGVVILAYYENTCIAGGIFLNFGNAAVYKYGASDREHQSLSATNLIVWEAIKFYIGRKAETLCFGRTDYSNEGLRTFKRGWATEEQVVNYFRYDLKRGDFIKGSADLSPMYNAVFRKVPLFMLRGIGGLVYRHMG